MQPTFLFPDALCIEPTAAEPVQAIARRVFARYRQVRVVDDASAVPLEMPWEVWLKQRFALAGSASIEAASAFADGVKTPCWRVTPVHLHLGRDHLVLTNPAQLQMAFADARSLGDSIQSVLQDSGLELNVVVPDRWYLSIKDAGSHWLDGLSAQGWRAPSGRNVDAYSPTGAQSRNWRRLLNEIQMSWHEHPINEQRAAKGLPAVNSLWLDGLALPASATDFKCCYSDLTALKGL